MWLLTCPTTNNDPVMNIAESSGASERSATASAMVWVRVALGGAGQLSHLAEGLRTGASAVASGSAFVFIGRLRAVLITYPSHHDVKELIANGGASS